MSAAQLRLSLTDQETEMLDAMRGPATRTAYALYLLVETLRQRTREGRTYREGEAHTEKENES